ncbi:putative TraG_N domain-containing protein [Vibrio jasicida]|uniref:TraG_N domain-containing protein n=1 Tax=Vibrio jasicida TaxID=766224 RepID=A0AAU9QWM8_9VIBR|nr:putative TraG_N domain-containing protein [Vibrio jasicida]CAH1601480.1 putative TraG_N domain-containing protein [Vibrio jasicida]
MALEIYTNGDMAFMEAILTGMGHVYNDGFLGQIFAMALLANALVSLLKFVNDSRSGFLTSFWQAIILYLVMFSATTKITLTKIGEGTRPIAGDFPVGVVAPAYFISMIGAKIAERFRDNIVVIDAGWGNTSNTAILEYGLSPLEALMKIRSENFAGAFEKSDLLSDIANPDGGSSGLGTAIGTYYSHCVEKAVKLSQLDPTGIPYLRRISGAKVNSDYWGSLRIDEPWPLTYDLDGQIKSGTCTTAHEDIGLALKKRSEELAQAKIYDLSHDRSDLTAAEEFSRMKDFYEKIDPITGADAISKLSSNMYTALMAEGACKDSVLMGPEFVQACTAQWDAIQNRRVQEASKADSFLEMLSPMVTFIEGFVYVISPFMILLILFTGGSGLKMMGKYLTALLWVTLIPICQVAVDVYLNTYFNRFLYSLNQDGAGTSLVSIQAQESVWTELESFVAFAGTAQAMVPALAMFIIFAGVHTLQGMGAGMASGAAIDGSKLHSNKAVSIKDGSYGYGQTNVVEARNEYGTQVGGEQIRAHASNLDAGATNFKMGINTNEQHASKLAASQTYTNALKDDMAVKSDKAFGKSWSDGRDFNVQEAARYGVSKAAALDQSYSQVLQDTYGFSQAAAQDLAREVRIAAGGSISGSVGLDVLGNSLKLAGKGETGWSAKDQEAFKTATEDSTKLAEAFNSMQKATEQVDNAYTNAVSSGEISGYKEDYKEAETAYFQASAAYQKQVAAQSSLEKSKGMGISQTLDDGGFASAASVSQGGMNAVIRSAGVEQFRNELAGVITKDEISDLNKLRNMDQDELNSFMNSLTEGKSQSYTSDLDAIGISKEGGNWSVDSNSDYSAELAGLKDGNEFEARTASGRDGGNAERATLVSSLIKGVDDIRDRLSLDHDKEAMIAAGNVYERMANTKHGSIQGVDGELTHGGMANFANKYKEAAQDLVDVNTGYDNLLDSNGMSKLNSQGEDNIDKQLKSGQLTKLQAEHTATGSETIDKRGNDVKTGFEKRSDHVTGAITTSLDGIEGEPNLSTMSTSDRQNAIGQEVAAKHDKLNAQGKAAEEEGQEVKGFTQEQLVIEQAEAKSQYAAQSDAVVKMMGDNANLPVNYTPDQLSLSRELNDELGELKEAQKYFDTPEAKASFQGIGDDGVAQFQDYIKGGETSLDEVMDTFKGQYIADNPEELKQALENVRTSYQDVSSVESKAESTFDVGGVEALYRGANYVSDNSFGLDKTDGIAGMNMTGSTFDKVDPDEIKGVDKMGDLSVIETANAIEYRLSRSASEAIDVSSDTFNKAYDAVSSIRLDNIFGDDKK